MALLEIENLSVEFSRRSSVLKAVDDVSFKVDAGDILAIVGESGSGKSVAMLALMRLLPWNAKVTATRLAFDGQDLLTLSPRQRRAIIGKDMCMIFQEPMTSLNPCFSVGFQLSEVLKTHLKMPRAARRRRAIELLEQVGIPAAEKRLSAFPHQLSGGMNQRVMIAMSIACNPKLIIADEPTTALDVTIQAQILDLLLGLQRDNAMALILITHDLGVVAQTAERVVVQYAGQQVEEQPVADLFEHPRHPYSAALLASLLSVTSPRVGQRLAAIAGRVPGQFDRPRGCLFSPRCSLATELCRTSAPPYAAAQGFVRCHYPSGD